MLLCAVQLKYKIISKYLQLFRGQIEMKPWSLLELSQSLISQICHYYCCICSSMYRLLLSYLVVVVVVVVSQFKLWLSTLCISVLGYHCQLDSINNNHP